MNTRRTTFAATALLGLLGLAGLTACGTPAAPAATPTPTATVTVTALTPECEDALNEADMLGESYAAYLGMTGDLFGAVSKLDWASVNEHAPSVQAHMGDAVKTAQAYAVARDACRGQK